MNYSYLFRQPISTLRILTQSLKFTVSSFTNVPFLCPFYLSCQMNRTNLPITFSLLIPLSLFSFSALLYHPLSFLFHVPSVDLFFLQFSFSLSVCGWLWAGMTAAPDRLWHDCTRCQLGVCCSSTPLPHTCLFYLSCSLCHPTVCMRRVEWPLSPSTAATCFLKGVFHVDLVLLCVQGHTLTETLN